jgi:hypothetical protein
LFESAAEKLGDELLLLDDDVPPAAEGDEVEDELDGLVVEDELSEALGVELVEGLVDGLLDEEDEDCATASVDSAKRTAAVVMLSVLGMDVISNGWVELRPPMGKRRARQAREFAAAAGSHSAPRQR